MCLPCINVLDCTKEIFIEHYLTVKEYLKKLCEGTCESVNVTKEAEYKTQELEKLEILFEVRFAEPIKVYT